MQLFIGNYGRHLEVDITENGLPVLPESATITILNMDAGTTVLADEAATVVTGSAYYSIPSGSAITSSSAHMVAYLDVMVSSGNLHTYPLYFDVLDKGSYLILDQWRRKVEESSPSADLLEDEDARDWIDSAVAYVNKNYRDTGYTSVLGSISPAPTANDREFFASVASLMARTSWHAGKGKWRDEELSMDPGPFKDEWARLDLVMSKDADNQLMTGSVFSAFNRDNVFGDGYKHDSPAYWQVPSGSTQLTSTIPV